MRIKHTVTTLLAMSAVSVWASSAMAQDPVTSQRHQQQMMQQQQMVHLQQMAQRMNRVMDQSQMMSHAMRQQMTQLQKQTNLQNQEQLMAQCRLMMNAGEALGMMAREGRNLTEQVQAMLRNQTKTGNRDMMQDMERLQQHLGDMTDQMEESLQIMEQMQLRLQTPES